MSRGQIASYLTQLVCICPRASCDPLPDSCHFSRTALLCQMLSPTVLCSSLKNCISHHGLDIKP
jgi:hypothetical protein